MRQLQTNPLLNNKIKKKRRQFFVGFFSLCGEKFFAVAQVGKRWAFCFGFYLLFGRYFGGADAFFSTRSAWLHAQARRGMVVKTYASIALFP
jgi:hypothetical protein